MESQANGNIYTQIHTETDKKRKTTSIYFIAFETWGIGVTAIRDFQNVYILRKMLPDNEKIEGK